VEVMGRDAGFLTLNAGIAVGATAIVVPEIKVHVKEHIISHIENSREKGKKHFIIMIAEGVGGVEALAEYIEEKTGIESRASILGHVQRGGSPTVRDRVLASEMGYSAVKLLMQGMGNRVVAIKKDEIVNYDIYEALNMKKTIDQAFYNMAHEISI
jgi:6-phosphofructokinase 1